MTLLTGVAAQGQRPSEQEAAYKLLVELLTHQFAFPVKWIDTQRALLDSNKDVQRVVEIGPAKVLTSMAKKTAGRVVGDKDLAHARERDFLFVNDVSDARKIYYTYDQDDISSDASTAEGLAAANITPPQAPGPALAPVPQDAVRVPAAISLTPAEVPDAALNPTDIILALVAHKFRKSFDQLSLQESLRALSAGKSVVQNELLGDLGAEFGDLPEGSEDLTLEALGLKLATGFSGKPGKTMKKLVERMLTSKMPAGFNQGAVAEYLRARWGLGPHRQTAVLGFAVTMEPAGRLGDVSQAQSFIDSVASRYATHAGVTLQTQQSLGAAATGQSNAVVQVDQASLDALKRDNTEYLRRQFQLLARHLNIDIVPHVEVAVEDGSQTQDTTSQLYTELDEEFITGIRGVFDPRKQRRYASFWNWVREDVARLLFSPDTSGEGVISSSIASKQQLQSMLNRWTPALEKMLQHYAKVGPARGVAEDLLAHKSRSQGNSPVFRYSEPAMAPHTVIDEQGQIHYSEVPRAQGTDLGLSLISNYYHTLASSNSPSRAYIHLRSRQGGKWGFDAQLTDACFSAIFEGATSGFNFSGKTALVTGAGPDSIGAEIVSGLLAGGARVIVTTSRAPSNAARFFRQMYKDLGAQGSELIVLPFNAASKKDCEDLITYIYDENKGLNADLDFVVPFAAIPESGREIDRIDMKSELAHRAMLVNVLRMLGSIKQAKEQRRYTGRPTTVVLPLSPNHGEFGGDGLYAESKLGLETLLNRFHSESWSAYLSVIGAVIGWTRGTGLMSANNIVAEGIEALGVLTFTPAEMGFNILTLLSPSLIALPDLGPVYADLSGGLQGFEGLKDKLASIREDITTKRRIRQALVAEERLHESVLRGNDSSLGNQKQSITPKPGNPRSNIRQAFPRLDPQTQMTAGLQNLVGTVDFSRTVVVVGFSELGPWGSSRTRWEVESRGRLTQEGLTEMAWIMGLIKHFNGDIQGKPYVGWVDKKTGEAVHDSEIGARYGEHIMSHAGIRAVELERLDGYDPANKELLHEIVLDEPLPPFEASESLAKAFKQRHGDKASVYPKTGDSDSWMVAVGAGATFLIPKSVSSQQFVAAQLPSGWDPVTYGIPEDIISQVDPITLYVLCCVCEAMYSAGIEDPFELYKHIHVSELANCIGTGAGGLKSMRGMYKHRYLEKSIQSDILQETFLNSMAAWTNMLLFGAAGPIKTPTGTCATAVESLDTACEAIQSRRVKVALVGGVDEFAEEGSHEFSNMKATSNAEEETAKGFLPAEMSRPMASSRAGFMEAAGCGVQIVMSAELALQMGLPIYGIVAYTQLAGDGVGRSLPAPGQGVLTAARESPLASHSPLLDLQYRQAKLQASLADTERWRLTQLGGISSSPLSLHNTAINNDKVRKEQMIEAAANCRKRDAQWMWNGGNLRQLDPTISPMRAALSVWGLTIDDIKVASFHGTSTKANDKNESRVIDQQMRHLSRSIGNPLFVVCQKYLTGHPKGAAGAWMLNGCLQILETGLVPGNRNADDVDAALEAFEHLLYPSEAVACCPGSIKACMLTSFGFGQKGGIVIVVAPRSLFAALPEEQYETYRLLVAQRQRRIDRAYQLAMMQNNVFKAKDKSAWATEKESAVFLDPEARL